MKGTLTGTSILCQSGPGSNGNEGVLHIPQTLRLEPHHQMQVNVIHRTLKNDIYQIAYRQVLNKYHHRKWTRQTEIKY